MDIKLKSSPTGTGITPQMPTEPPKEVKEMTFSQPPEGMFGGEPSSTITTDNGTVLKEEPKVTEVVETKEEKSALTPPKTDKEVVKKEQTKDEIKKEEPKKEESKSVLKPPTAENISKTDNKDGGSKTDTTNVLDKGKEVIKPITPVKEQNGDTFDYTKYSPQEVINLKNMSRQSREWAAKLIDEAKNLAPLKDANYLQHEQGYTLSPEYKQKQEQVYLAATEARVWEQQLLKIKAGEKYQNLQGFDAKGQPVMGPEVVASPADEIRISSNYNLCVNAAQQRNGELQMYPNQFKQRMQQDMQAIQQEQHNRFAWVQDPKLLEYSVHIEGAGDQKLKDIKSNFKSLFPQYLQNSVGVDVASNLVVALQIQSAELREARNGQQVAQIKQEEAVRGEPTSNSTERVAKVDTKGVPTTFDASKMMDALGIR